MRERLRSIIDSLVDNEQYEIEDIVDYLLANGVIVPPCKVGEKVYYHGGIHKSLVKSAVVEEIIINSCGVGDLLVTSENGVTFENSIDIFYFTKEEAEQALFATEINVGDKGKGGAEK